MVQLVCPCLNIRIHGKGTAVQLRDSRDIKLSDRTLADDFFSSQIYDVILDLGGVTKAQKSLCASRHIDGWVITSCVGCELEIYAKHVDDHDRVLVSCSIEKDPSRITTLMESENYSSLFKFLLPEINDNFAQNNLGLGLCSANSSFERAFKHMQQQVASYLNEEHKAMEERIRVFTEQQQSMYSSLQQKVKKHKQAMLFLLLKRQDLKKSLENPLCDSFSPPSITQHLSDDSSSSSDSVHAQDKFSDFFMEAVQPVNAPLPRRPFRRMHSVNNPPQRNKVARPLKHKTIDVGDVFDMEGFETGETDVPFYNSDDDTDGSSTEDTVHSKRSEKSSNQYAGSVPISVPGWSSYSRNSMQESDEHVIVHRDAEQLAASFRALTDGPSVNDGTEIFGDLPRRRLNTGELLRSRPI